MGERERKGGSDFFFQGVEDGVVRRVLMGVLIGRWMAWGKSEISPNFKGRLPWLDGLGWGWMEWDGTGNCGFFLGKGSRG